MKTDTSILVKAASGDPDIQHTGATSVLAAILDDLDAADAPIHVTSKTPPLVLSREKRDTPEPFRWD